MAHEETWDIFISYATPDRQRVEPFFEAVRNDCAVFFDTANVRTGDRVLPRIRKAIPRSRVFVAFLSKHSEKARYQDGEIRLAVEAAKGGQPRRTVAVLLDEDSATYDEHNLTIDAPLGRPGDLPDQVATKAFALLLRLQREDAPTSPVDLGFPGQTAEDDVLPAIAKVLEDLAGRARSQIRHILEQVDLPSSDDPTWLGVLRRLGPADIDRVLLHLLPDDPDQITPLRARLAPRVQAAMRDEVVDRSLQIRLDAARESIRRGELSDAIRTLNVLEVDVGLGAADPEIKAGMTSAIGTERARIALRQRRTDDAISLLRGLPVGLTDPVAQERCVRLLVTLDEWGLALAHASDRADLSELVTRMRTADPDEALSDPSVPTWARLKVLVDASVRGDHQAVVRGVATLAEPQPEDAPTALDLLSLLVSTLHADLFDLGARTHPLQDAHRSDALKLAHRLHTGLAGLDLPPDQHKTLQHLRFVLAVDEADDTWFAGQAAPPPADPPQHPAPHTLEHPWFLGLEGAKRHRQDGRPAQAVQELDELVARFPGRVPLLTELARALLALPEAQQRARELERARRCAQEAFKRFPGLGQRLTLAQICSRRGDARTVWDLLHAVSEATEPVLELTSWAALELRRPEALTLAEQLRDRAGANATRRHRLQVEFARDVSGTPEQAMEGAWRILQEEGADSEGRQLDATDVSRIFLMLVRRTHVDRAAPRRLQRWSAWSLQWFPDHPVHIHARLAISDPHASEYSAEHQRALSAGLFAVVDDDRYAQLVVDRLRRQGSALAMYADGLASFRWVRDATGMSSAALWMELAHVNPTRLVVPAPGIGGRAPETCAVILSVLELLLFAELGLLPQVLRPGGRRVLLFDDDDVRLRAEAADAGLPNRVSGHAVADRVRDWMDGRGRAGETTGVGDDRAWLATQLGGWRYVDVRSSTPDDRVDITTDVGEILTTLASDGLIASGSALTGPDGRLTGPGPMALSADAVRHLAEHDALGALDRWLAGKGGPALVGPAARAELASWLDARAAQQRADELIREVARQVEEAESRGVIEVLGPLPTDVVGLPAPPPGADLLREAAQEALRYQEAMVRGLTPSDAILVTMDGPTAGLLTRMNTPGLAPALGFTTPGDWSRFSAPLRELAERVINPAAFLLSDPAMVERLDEVRRLELLRLGLHDAIDATWLTGRLSGFHVARGGEWESLIDRLIGASARRFRRTGDLEDIYLGFVLAETVLWAWTGVPPGNQQETVSAFYFAPPISRPDAEQVTRHVLTRWHDRTQAHPVTTGWLPSILATGMIQLKALGAWGQREEGRFWFTPDSPAATLWRFLTTEGPDAEPRRRVMEQALIEEMDGPIWETSPTPMLLGGVVGWGDHAQELRTLQGQTTTIQPINTPLGAAVAIRSAIWAHRPTSFVGFEARGTKQSWTYEDMLGMAAAGLLTRPVQVCGLDWKFDLPDIETNLVVLLPADAVLLRAAPEVRAQLAPLLADAWAPLDARVSKAILSWRDDPTPARLQAWARAAATSPYRRMREDPRLLQSWSIGAPIHHRIRDLDELRAMLGVGSDPESDPAGRPGAIARTLRACDWLPGTVAIQRLQRDLSPTTRGTASLAWLGLLDSPRTASPGALFRAIVGLRALASDPGTIEVDGASLNLRTLLPHALAMALHRTASPTGSDPAAAGDPSTSRGVHVAPSGAEEALQRLGRLTSKVVSTFANVGEPEPEDLLSLTWLLAGWFAETVQDGIHTVLDFLVEDLPHPPGHALKPHPLDPWHMEREGWDLPTAVLLSATAQMDWMLGRREAPPDRFEPGALVAHWVMLASRPMGPTELALLRTTPSHQLWVGPTSIPDLALTNILVHASDGWWELPEPVRLGFLDRLTDPKAPLHALSRRAILAHVARNASRLLTHEIDAIDQALDGLRAEIPPYLWLGAAIAMFLRGRQGRREGIHLALTELEDRSERDSLAGAFLDAMIPNQVDPLSEAEHLNHLLRDRGHSVATGVIGVLRLHAAGLVDEEHARSFARRWTGDAEVRNDPHLIAVLQSLSLDLGG